MAGGDLTGHCGEEGKCARASEGKKLRRLVEVGLRGSMHWLQWDGLVKSTGCVGAGRLGKCRG